MLSVTANTVHFNPKKTDYRSFFSGYLFVGGQQCHAIDTINMSITEIPPVISSYVTGMLDKELTTATLHKVLITR